MNFLCSPLSQLSTVGSQCKTGFESHGCCLVANTSFDGSLSKLMLMTA